MKNARALEGVKVADFTWVAIGPLATKFLANMGATVIHIESQTRTDMLRMSQPYKDFVPGPNRAVMFAVYNDSKYGISLNLKIPQAQKVAKRLVRDWADVVVDNQRPGVMEGWGLDYDSLRKEKPDLIHVATAFQGKTGPYSVMPAIGNVAISLAGYTEITGWPDREPAIPHGAYTDFVAFPHLITVLIAALIYRRKTGKGQYIDLSQLESSLQSIGPVVMDYMINGRIMKRVGNRSTNAAPHAVYRCLGEDRWCAIAVSTDEEWRNFCNVIGNPEWTRDPRFTTLRARKENEDALNALVEEWTQQYPPEELMSRMQAAGVPAGLASASADLIDDPQMKHRGLLTTLEHPEIGPHFYQRPPYLMSKTPVEITMPAPCLGQHNEYVLKQILGMSDDEVAELVVAGALE